MLSSRKTIYIYIYIYIYILFKVMLHDNGLEKPFFKHVSDSEKSIKKLHDHLHNNGVTSSIMLM
jgi:hypothetical protein